MLLSISVTDDFNAEFHHLEHKLQFLLALLIALAIFKADFPLKKTVVKITHNTFITSK
jgi:hypothetical protein